MTIKKFYFNLHMANYRGIPNFSFTRMVPKILFAFVVACSFISASEIPSELENPPVLRLALTIKTGNEDFSSDLDLSVLGIRRLENDASSSKRARLVDTSDEDGTDNQDAASTTSSPTAEISEQEAAPLTVVSCMKGTTSRPPRSVTFHPDAIDASTYDVNGEDAETRFFDAVFRRQFNLAFAMRQQGFVLSNSQLVFYRIMGILRSQNPMNEFIRFFFANYPYVFTQKYDEKLGSIYHGISQNNVDFILTNYPTARAVHLGLFKEALRNRNLILNADIFDISEMKYEHVQQLIQAAEESKREDVVADIVAKAPNFRNHETSILIEAIDKIYLSQIEIILKRSDAIRLVLFKPDIGPYEGRNAIDLAIKAHDDGKDEHYSVMLALLPILHQFNSITRFDDARALLNDFTDNCFEADNNETILMALKDELDSIWLWAKIKLIPQEFIALIQDKLARFSAEGPESEEETVVDEAEVNIVSYDADLLDNEPTEQTDEDEDDLVSLSDSDSN